MLIFGLSTHFWIRYSSTSSPESVGQASLPSLDRIPLHTWTSKISWWICGSDLLPSLQSLPNSTVQAVKISRPTRGLRSLPGRQRLHIVTCSDFVWFDLSRFAGMFQCQGRWHLQSMWHLQKVRVSKFQSCHLWVRWMSWMFRVQHAWHAVPKRAFSWSHQGRLQNWKSVFFEIWSCKQIQNTFIKVRILRNSSPYLKVNYTCRIHEGDMSSRFDEFWVTKDGVYHSAGITRRASASYWNGGAERKTRVIRNEAFHRDASMIAFSFYFLFRWPLRWSHKVRYIELVVCIE